MDVIEVLLPGVGVRYEFSTASGDQLGIIAHRAGDIDVVRYGDDPDSSTPLFQLTADEAETVAELLGAPRIAERLADLTREIPGLAAGQVPVGDESAYAGRPLGDTRARTLTGASIVAVVRRDGVTASPRPTEVLRPGDVLIVVGTREGIAGVASIIGG